MSKFIYLYKDPSTFTEGETPYGIYDADTTFQSESVKICQYVLTYVKNQPNNSLSGHRSSICQKKYQKY